MDEILSHVGSPRGSQGGPGEKKYEKTDGKLEVLENKHQILSTKVAILATRQAHVQKHLIKVKKNNVRMDMFWGRVWKTDGKSEVLKKKH